MSLALSVIIGLVVLVFAVLAFAPMLTSSASNEKAATPTLRVIEGGKSGMHKDAA